MSKIALSCARHSTGDGAYWRTLETLWHDLTAGKMYLTGGVGSRAQGEAFGRAYELPNRDAYTESCAAIGNMSVLYNGVNSGRSLPGLLYSTSTVGVGVHLYHNSTLNWRLEDHTPLELRQATECPGRGDVSIEVNPARETGCTAFLGIPAWTRLAMVNVNGVETPQKPTPGEYFTLRRAGRKGGSIPLALDMPARLTVAHPMVSENGVRVAIERGPLVYCLEQHELPAGVSVFDVALQTGKGKLPAEHRPDLLSGIWTIGASGVARAHPPCACGCPRPRTPIARAAAVS